MGFIVLLTGVMTYGSAKETKLAIDRRSFTATLASGLAIVIGGCSAEDGDANDDGSNDDGSNDDGSNDDSEILHDTTVYTDKRWPHEFSPGDKLKVEMTIEEGGPGLFTVNRPENDVLNTTRVDTSKEFTHEIEYQGRYYLSVNPGGTAKVLVKLIEDAQES